MSASLVHIVLTVPATINPQAKTPILTLDTASFGGAGVDTLLPLLAGENGERRLIRRILARKLIRKTDLGARRRYCSDAMLRNAHLACDHGIKG